MCEAMCEGHGMLIFLCQLYVVPLLSNLIEGNNALPAAA